MPNLFTTKLSYVYRTIIGSERESVSTPRVCWVSASRACWAAGRRSSYRLCFRTSDRVSGCHPGHGTRSKLSAPFRKARKTILRNRSRTRHPPWRVGAGMSQPAQSSCGSEVHPPRALIPHWINGLSSTWIALAFYLAAKLRRKSWFRNRCLGASSPNPRLGRREDGQLNAETSDFFKPAPMCHFYRFLCRAEKAALEKALQVTGGSIPAAAELLGIGKTTAYRKVNQYGLATGTSAAFCPNCGRRLPRCNPITAREVSPCLTATSGQVPSPLQ